MSRRRNKLSQNLNTSLKQRLLLQSALIGGLVFAGVLAFFSIDSTEGCKATEASISIPDIILPALDLDKSATISVNSTPSGTEGANTLYLLTDEQGIIQEVQNSSPSFAARSAGGYFIFAATYNGTASGLGIGDTISKASSTECLDISDALPMVSFYADEFSNTEPITFPSDNPKPGTNSMLYLLVDINGNIVESNTTNSFSAQSAGGQFFIYSVSLSNPYSPANGEGIESLPLSGTYFFSDPYPIVVSGTTFPVEWLSFTAELRPQGSLLEWATASELNSDYFDVERSIDGDLFVQIGQVKARGNSQELAEYDYTDRQFPTLGIDKAFYRLKQVDFDGKFEYSPSIELSLRGTSGLNLGAYPNPFTDYINVSFVPSSSTLLKVFDAQGKLMMSRPFQELDKQEHSIQTHGWSEGVYFIRVEGEYVSASLTVLKE